MITTQKSGERKTENTARFTAEIILESSMYYREPVCQLKSENLPRSLVGNRPKETASQY